MQDSLSPYEIDNLIKLDKLRSFVELVASGPRSDGTYNYCREALQRRASQLLNELKNETMENMG
jgi:hypothetical protein